MRLSRFHKGGLAGALLGLLLYISTSDHSAYTPPQPDSTSPVEHEVIKTSIVVPSYKEADNMKPLVTKIFEHAPDPKALEVIIVDDNSGDGTVEVIDSLKEEGFGVRLIVRTTERGLSSAVLRGFKEAKGNYMIVMDADLQHPPATIPAFVSALENPNSPLVLGTRYGPGVSMSANWPLYRRIISWGARILARPLTSASDPMTGFFGIRKDYYLKSRPINPSGFKIALELMLKTPREPNQVLGEVPYSFATRTVGQSKLTSKVMFRYVGQLAKLYRWKLGWFGVMILGALVGTMSVAIAHLGMLLLVELNGQRKVRLTARRKAKWQV